MLSYRRKRELEAEEGYRESLTRSVKSSWLSTVWSFLNSSFFLWIAGGLALSALANAYSERQRCLSDVRSARDRFVIATLEQNERIHKLLLGAADAKDSKELKELIAKSRTLTAHTYLRFKDAGIREVSLEWARSAKELGRFEEGAVLTYMAVFAHRPEILLTKQILFGADFSEDDLEAWKEFAGKVIEQEKSLITKAPRSIFDVVYPRELEAVEEVKVCSWQEIASKEIGIGSDTDPE